MSQRVVRRKAKVVTVRVDEAMQAALAAAAERAGVSRARLARALLVFGLAELERGNATLERALRGSRDAAADRAIRGSRDTTTRAKRAVRSSRDG